MLKSLPIPLLLLLGACGGEQTTAEQLEEAAEQSNPRAAMVLNNAAEELREQEGAAPPGAAQEALREAGRAQVQNPIDHSSTLQAEPNLPQDPNRPPAGEAPEKIDVAKGGNGAAAQDEHAGHDMGNQQ